MTNWDDADAVRANQAGTLAPGQAERLLGVRVPPPVVGPMLVAAGTVAAAVLASVRQFGWAVTVFLVLLSFGGAAMGVNLDRRRQRRRLRSDLAAPVIGNGPGEVVTDPQGGVEIRSGTARLALGPAAPDPPAPGRYHVYWLEHPSARRWDRDRVLLSATPLPSETPPPPDADVSRRLLALALGGNDWELTFNRAGRLSPPQLWRLTGALRRSVRRCVIGMLAAAGLMVLGSYELTHPQPDDTPATTRGIAGLTFGVGVLVAVIATAVLLRRRRRRVLCAGTIDQVTGRVTVRRVALNGENDLDWRVTLGDLRFDLTTAAARGFFAPGAYTLYHVHDESSPTLLAAEPAPHRPLGPPQPWPRADWAEANASGGLPTDQRALLLGTAPSSGLRFLAGLESVLVGALLVNYLLAPPGPAAHQIAAAFGLPATILVVWLTVHARRSVAYRRHAHQVARSQVDTAPGEISWEAGRYHATAGALRLRPLWPDYPPPTPGSYQLHWLAGARPMLLSATPTRVGEIRRT